MASPFLSAGTTTGDSGGELSSGDDSGDVESLPSPESGASRSLAELFEAAAAHLQSLVHVASREQLLYLYARYKQVRSRGATRGLLCPANTNSKRAWETASNEVLCVLFVVVFIIPSSIIRDTERTCLLSWE